jgi:hypothetical protein
VIFSVPVALQEYLELNDKALHYIVAMGAHNATISDAAAAWLDIEQGLLACDTTSFPNLFASNASGNAQFTALKHVLAMRIKGGLTKWHCLALLLAPRPKMRKIAQGLVGNAADKNLGNTAFIHQANAAIDEIASVVITYKRDKSQRTKAQTAAVLKAQLLAFIEVCESVCVATTSVCVCHHASITVYKLCTLQTMCWPASLFHVA